MPKKFQSGSPPQAYQRYTNTDGRQGLLADETVSPVVDLARLEKTPFGGGAVTPTAFAFPAAASAAATIRYFVLTPRDDTGLVALECLTWGIQSTTSAFFLAKIVTGAERPAYSAGAFAFLDLPNLNSVEVNAAIALLRPVAQECVIAGAAFPATGRIIDALRTNTTQSESKPFPPGTCLRGDQALIFWTPTNAPTYGMSFGGRVWTQARPRQE